MVIKFIDEYYRVILNSYVCDISLEQMSVKTNRNHSFVLENVSITDMLLQIWQHGHINPHLFHERK